MERERMARAALTPRQAVASATRDAARCLRLDRELGTLEPGQWADLVVLDADPLVAIRNVRRISAVWVAGNRVARRRLHRPSSRAQRGISPSPTALTPA